MFLISKTDAWDENGRLCKIGRVRVKFDPPLAVKVRFRQELKLREGVIAIETEVQNQPATIRLWVDANQPVVHVEAESAVPARCRAEVELWRLREWPFGPNDDSHCGGGLSGQACKPVVLPDVVVTSAAPRVVWYHRDTRSVYELGLQVQHLEALKGRFADPLLNRTFGASLCGEGFVSDGKQAIKSAAAGEAPCVVRALFSRRSPKRRRHGWRNWIGWRAGPASCTWRKRGSTMRHGGGSSGREVGSSSAVLPRGTGRDPRLRAAAIHDRRRRPRRFAHQVQRFDLHGGSQAGWRRPKRRTAIRIGDSGAATTGSRTRGSHIGRCWHPATSR